MVQTAANIWRDFVTDGIPASGKQKPFKPDIREWGTAMESIIAAGTLSDAVWKTTKAILDADLAHAADTIGVVYDDSTSANNGLYKKSGASGSGSWTQLTTFLPGYQFVKATDAGAGTANAIVATTSPQLPSGDGVALVRLNIFETNTSEDVTVAFDGGTALTIKTVTDDKPTIGSLVAGSAVLGTVENSGTVFRLASESVLSINWQGSWTTATTYTRNDAVKHNGASYIATAGHTSAAATEPGVGADWATVWDLLAQKGDAGVGETLPSVANNWIRRNAGNTAYEAKTDAETQELITFAGTFANSLAADGATDDVAALVALEGTAQEVIRLKNATYYIGTNYTPTKTLRFSSGTRFLIAAGVTVDFSSAQPEIHAPKKQNFEFGGTGTGAVVGLDVVRLGWFAGDKINTVNDARSEIQRAYDACADYGAVRWPRGFVSGDMSSPISVSRGQKTIGYGRRASKLRFLTAACNGFSVTGFNGAEFRGVGWEANDELNRPTSGALIKGDTVSSIIISGVESRWAYDGFLFNGCLGVKADQFNLENSWNTGVFIEECNDLFFDQFLISALYEHLAVSGLSGNFTAGETITGGTSGATGTVIEVLSSGVLKIRTIYTFSASETVTGGTSGATATVVSHTKTHSLGGIRLREKAEAMIFTNGDIIGGEYSMTTGAVAFGGGSRPAYCRFTNVFFDASKSGCFIDDAVEFDFIGCWFSNRPEHGCQLAQVDGIRFIGGGAINCGKHGVLVNTASKRVVFDGGFRASGNSTEAASTYHGIAIGGGTTDFVIQNCIVGGGTLGFGSQGTGIVVFPGASDRYVITNNMVSGDGGGISDGGTGSDKYVAHNPGYKTSNAGSAAVTFDGSGLGNWPHGLAGEPLEYWGRTEGDTVNEVIIIDADASNIYGKLRSTVDGAASSGTVTVKWSAKMPGAS